jgi:aryl-alcohol dehydrogenase-like predicted oxidoreductase
MAKSPMPKRQTNAPPALALGAMNFGKRTSPEESERIVRRALERGIALFDTANSYNGGESERILGRALGRDRERVVLSTKVGLGPDPARREGLSHEAIRRAIVGSLERLGVDSVDLYYLHVPDRSTPIEESLDGIRELVGSGRVRSWAVSNYASWEIFEMNLLARERGLEPPTAAQLLYNAMHRQLDVEFFAFARRYPIHTSVYNILAGGLLTGQHDPDREPAKGSRFDQNPMYQKRYWTKAMFERVQALRAIAAEEGRSLVELAYAFVASKLDVDSILLGPATVEQLDQAIDAVALSLSAEASARLDELAREWSGTDTNYAR